MLLLRLALMAACAWIGVTAAAAQTYPDHPIKSVVPAASGRWTKLIKEARISAGQ